MNQSKIQNNSLCQKRKQDRYSHHSYDKHLNEQTIRQHCQLSLSAGLIFFVVIFCNIFIHPKHALRERFTIDSIVHFTALILIQQLYKIKSRYHFISEIKVQSVIQYHYILCILGMRLYTQHIKGHHVYIYKYTQVKELCPYRQCNVWYQIDMVFMPK